MNKTDRIIKTINNFDYTICKGFERNNLIMKQIKMPVHLPAQKTESPKILIRALRIFKIKPIILTALFCLVAIPKQNPAIESGNVITENKK